MSLIHLDRSFNIRWPPQDRRRPQATVPFGSLSRPPRCWSARHRPHKGGPLRPKKAPPARQLSRAVVPTADPLTDRVKKGKEKKKRKIKTEWRPCPPVRRFFLSPAEWGLATPRVLPGPPSRRARPRRGTIWFALEFACSARVCPLKSFRPWLRGCSYQSAVSGGDFEVSSTDEHMPLIAASMRSLRDLDSESGDKTSFASMMSPVRSAEPRSAQLARPGAIFPAPRRARRPGTARPTHCWASLALVRLSTTRSSASA